MKPINEFKINLFSLSFEKDLENEFRDDYFRTSLRQVRLSLLLAIFFYGIFGLLDMWIVPEVKKYFWFIRYVIFCPFVLLIYMFSYTSYFKKYTQVSVALVVLVAGLGIIAMILIAPLASSSSYYTGLILVFIFGYTFFKLRFVWASLTGWMIVFAYEIAAIWIIDTPVRILVNNNFFFLTGNILGMFACYSIEYYLRRDFMRARLLEAEKKKVDDANLNLERRVTERTKQLQTTNKQLERYILEQKETADALKQRVEFEQLIAALSTKFIHLNLDEIDSAIQNTLRTIGKFANVDCSYIHLFSFEDQSSITDFQWCCENNDSNLKKMRGKLVNNLPWFEAKIKKYQTINIKRVSQLSQKANPDKKQLKKQGIKSVLRVPMIFKDKVVGFIGFDSLKNESEWNRETCTLLKIVGGMLIITLERKRGEELLRQSEEKYRSLFQRSTDVVFISSPEGKFIDINPAGVKLFGYATRGELCNLNIAEKLFVHIADRDKYRRLLELQGYIKDYELILMRKDGQKVTVLETTTAVRDETGKILAYQGIMRDVTTRRKLESQLFQSHKMESIGLLAGGIAHDFNNILTAISGYTDLVLLQLNPNNPNYRHVNGILKGVKRAENLTRQLLAFSRKQIIEPKIIEINDVIFDLEKMLHRLIGEDINLEALLAKDVGRIKADPGQIEQILVNLIINARDAINQRTTQSSEKKITVETKGVYLDLNYVAQNPGSSVGQYMLIAVSDTGIGMNEEEKRKIFEPFYTTKERGKGTGLGLSTVYGIVKQNNGNIYVYSEPGKGTTFKVYWPSTDLEEIVDYNDNMEDELHNGQETILFVEDDKEVRNFVTTALKSLQYKIFEASNGVVALDLINEQKPDIDLLITDVVMPEMGGKELAEKIVKILPGIKILFTSGYTDNHIVRSGRLNKGLNFIQKPFSITEIAKKIRVVIED
jgi:two-component system cell cycle sensor histidine kinase/response regulator CckA